MWRFPIDNYILLTVCSFCFLFCFQFCFQDWLWHSCSHLSFVTVFKAWPLTFLLPERWSSLFPEFSSLINAVALIPSPVSTFCLLFACRSFLVILGFSFCVHSFLPFAVFLYSVVVFCSWLFSLFSSSANDLVSSFLYTAHLEVPFFSFFRCFSHSLEKLCHCHRIQSWGVLFIVTLRINFIHCNCWVAKLCLFHKINFAFAPE